MQSSLRNNRLLNIQWFYCRVNISINEHEYIIIVIKITFVHEQIMVFPHQVSKLTLKYDFDPNAKVECRVTLKSNPHVNIIRTPCGDVEINFWAPLFFSPTEPYSKSQTLFNQNEHPKKYVKYKMYICSRSLHLSS